MSDEPLRPLQDTDYEWGWSDHPIDRDPAPLTKPLATVHPFPPAATDGLPAEELEDATAVIAEGQAIDLAGIPYVVHGLIPNYGMLGFLVAFAKTGKTTFGLQLAAAVATGTPFLDRDTTQAKVLVLAAEDPPEYTAWLARHLAVPPGTLIFRRKPLILTSDALRQVCVTVTEQHVGFVIIASWQAVIRGLIKDENDNAGSVQQVERIKAAARETGIPWLIDAHAGKGEDQSDDADPSRAMRGASAAAGAADFTVSLRYANGTFATLRKLSAKGRFVNVDPIQLGFDPATSRYDSLGAMKDATRESTWRLVCETGALSEEPRSITEIARRSGLLATGDRLGGNQRKALQVAFAHRPEVGIDQIAWRGQKVTRYKRLSRDQSEPDA